ncbi:MAG: site-2 protease family protein [Firmicutes bacterium]|nr:site-2 protease family protein [Bacillota bacterium]
MVYAKDLWYYLLSVPGAVCALGLHEYVKALVSFRQGDPLPKLRGRLRANPFSHLDPLGLVVMLAAGYGWARPVPVSATYYRDRKSGTLITHVFPILVCIVVSCAAATLLALYKYFLLNSGAPLQGGMWNFNFAVYRMIFLFVRANLAVAFLNILPVYPLDGNAVLAAFLSPENAVKLKALERLTQLILLFALAAGLFGMAIDPLIMTLLKFAAL